MRCIEFQFSECKIPKSVSEGSNGCEYWAGYLGNLRKGNLVCTDPAIDPGKYSQIIECHIESSTLSLNVFRNHQLAC